MAKVRGFGMANRKAAAALMLSASLISLPVTPLLAQEAAQAGWQHYPMRPQAPEGAPNILIVMTDDVGFGSSSTFGGMIPTPNLDALAREGLRYTQFHTTAMCSPTRAALLTGRNHHSVNFGAIGNMSLDREGYTSVIPDSAATIGDVLGANGYNTGWIGKNHNTPLWEDTAMGPFDRWPNGLGFDYFYGFNGSQTDQFRPSLIENRNPLPVPEDPDYIFEKDMADHAIGWLRKQESLGQGAPFLLYYAPGTAHAPLQAPAEWLEKFRGKFDDGWDAMRQHIYQRQLDSGTIPAGTDISPRPDTVPAWDSLTAEEQQFSCRLMEAYAAMLAYSDDQFGRLVAELKRSGRYDNTLIVFIQGDNGASQESLYGEFNETAMFSQIDTRAKDLGRSAEVGSPASKPVNAAGWAWAMNAPFQWSKQIASHFGGTRNGLVMAWPEGIKDKGDVRRQFAHVVDIAPTLYELVGITPPAEVDGVKQQPFAGLSMAYSFDDDAPTDLPRTQYFEMLGNRAIWQDGWVAATTPRRMPWSTQYLKPDYDWELYNVNADFSQAHDLADAQPEKLAELKAAFQDMAQDNGVLPIDDRFIQRFGAGLRPGAFDTGNDFVFYPSDDVYGAKAFPTLNSEWLVETEFTVTGDGASAPLIVRGDQFSGWGLYMDKGNLRLVYSPTHVVEDRLDWTLAGMIDPGKHSVAVSVRQEYDGAHHLYLSVDGEPTLTRRLDNLTFGRSETGIGRQTEIPLVPLDKSAPASATVDKVVVRYLNR